jgi:hypothetical protein
MAVWTRQNVQARAVPTVKHCIVNVPSASYY